jgi:hypothetical protein
MAISNYGEIQTILRISLLTMNTHIQTLPEAVCKIKIITMYFFKVANQPDKIEHIGYTFKSRAELDSFLEEIRNGSFW